MNDVDVDVGVKTCQVLAYLTSTTFFLAAALCAVGEKVIAS